VAPTVDVPTSHCDLGRMSYGWDRRTSRLDRTRVLNRQPRWGRRWANDTSGHQSRRMLLYGPGLRWPPSAWRSLRLRLGARTFE